MDMLQAIQATVDMINNRSFAEEAHKVYDPDMVFIAGTGQEVRGLEEYIAFNRGFQAIVPDLSATLLEHEISGDTARVRLGIGGTFSDDMPLPDGGTIPSTGKRADWQSEGEVRLKDGKISYWAVTLDMQAFLRQFEED